MFYNSCFIFLVLSVMYPDNFLVGLFQPPVDYGSLEMTRQHRIQDFILGICYFSGRLYVVETSAYGVLPDRYRLAVYSVSDKDTLTILDTLDLETFDVDRQHPRVDRHSGQVYIPCGRYGVRVARYDGGKLVLVTTLRCVKEAGTLAVVSSDTLYIGDRHSRAVCLVDVTQDRVTYRLQKPRGLKTLGPTQIAFLGDTVLVYYYGGSLVLYRHGDPTPDKLLQHPSQGTWSVDAQQRWYVNALTTDHHSSLLAVDGCFCNVYVLDVSGNLTHTISIPGLGVWNPQDCTVVGEQLWVGCCKGEIIVMSSQ